MLDINSLRARERKLSDELTNVRQAIRALQTVCPHNWINDGHDSHKSYEKCSECGKDREA